jgi:hypothetical protein
VESVLATGFSVFPFNSVGIQPRNNPERRLLYLASWRTWFAEQRIVWDTSVDGLFVGGMAGLVDSEVALLVRVGLVLAAKVEPNAG